RITTRDSSMDALQAIRRQSMPQMYQHAFSKEKLRLNLARSEVPGRSENSSGSNSTGDVERDLLGNRLFQKAHMISDAKVGSKSYGFIAEATLGLRHTNPETRLKLVKGVEHTLSNGKIERVSQSGLKHNKYNKLRLFLQKEALDNNPFLIIIPIMTLTEVLDWDEIDPERDYSYNVMICSAGGLQAEVLYEKLFRDHRGPQSECTPQDVDTATTLLSTFARAMAMSTFNDSIMESMTARDRTNSHSVATVIDRINRATRDRHAEIDLPRINTTVVDVADPAALATRGIRIVKARVTKRTSLPDPYLVAVKAAANWFAGRNQRMLAAASVYDSENSDTDSECNDLHSSSLPGQAKPLDDLRR
ncbi:MAG: hypothetical protein SGILL_009762, partial [Bacillariaceae sp.]